MTRSSKQVAHSSQSARGKESTQRLTRRLCLVDISEISLDDQSCWKIKALAELDSDGNLRSEVINALKIWKQSEKEQFKRIIRSLKYVGKNQRHTDPTKVKADRKRREVYEVRANRCRCRLMFFYDTQSDNIVICTNSYWKGKGAHDKDQDNAFARCAGLRDIFLKTRTN